MKRVTFSLLQSLVLVGSLALPGQSSYSEAVVSKGRTSDPSSKTLSELRAAERRRIPLEVYLKPGRAPKAGNPVEVTIIITNLFPAKLLLNSRLLVNHPRLQGEIAFKIVDEKGNPLQIQSLVTPLTMREDDFVILGRGESIQRTVDLKDLYGMNHKGTYKVQAFYHNEVDFVADGRRAWKGRVWSEPIEVELHR